MGFVKAKSDTSLFVYRRDADTAYLLLYVDDIVLIASRSFSSVPLQLSNNSSR
jgi:hypothetical protein